MDVISAHLNGGFARAADLIALDRLVASAVLDGLDYKDLNSEVAGLAGVVPTTENLALVIEKRTKLVQTRSELERFQTSSNDFNCTMRLNDSDGNVFTTSFTPGIKKVIDFLKTQFDASITEAESKITF